jgi:hypothetical protein
VATVLLVEGVAAAGAGGLLCPAADLFGVFDAVRDGVGTKAGASVRATVVFAAQVLRVFRARQTSSTHTPRRTAVSPPSISDCERE